MPNKVASNSDPNDVEDAEGRLKYPRGIPFIIANEFCERFNFYGMRTILVLYLTRKLSYSDDTSTVIFHLFILLVYFFCIFGAIIADSWWGKFKTILWLSLVYVAGSLTLTLGAIEPWNMPANALTLLGLFLIALGSGGIKPCVSAFGGEQFKLPEQAKQLAVFFSLFYFSINAGSLISTTVTPILREDVRCFGMDDCFPLAFGVPAILMIIAVILFVGGKFLYKITPSQGNMFVNVCRCIGNAISIKLKEENPNPRSHWLDYAKAKHGEKLVKETKILLNVLVLYLPLPVFWALFDQQGSRWTFQATRMTGEIGSFEIKPDQMQVLNPLLILTFIPLYEAAFYPLLALIGIRRPLQKLALGGILAGVAFVISAFVEINLEKTYPILPGPGEAQLRIYNTRNCEYTFSSNITNHTNFVLMPMEHFEEKYIKIDPKMHSFEISVTASTCQQDVKFTKTFDLAEASSLGIVLQGKASDVVSAVQFEDNPDKSKHGFPLLRILATMQSDSEIILKDEDNVENYRKSKNGLDQVKLSTHSQYELFIGGNSVMKNIKFKLGGVYVLMIDELEELRYGESLKVITEPNSMHMLWLVPQFVVMTLGEVMFSITGLTFSFTQAPESMKSVIQGCWMLTTAIGNLIVVVIAGAKFMSSQVLEFLLFASLMFVDMFIFMILAYRYKEIPLEEVADTK